jgi:hypothetical protein
MGTRDEILEQLSKLNDERDSIHTAMTPMRNRLLAIHEEAITLQNKLVAHDREAGTVDIGYLISEFVPSGKGDLFYSALREWASRFSLCQAGSSVETAQPFFRVRIKRDGSNIESTLTGLHMLVPMLRPRDKTGRVTFGISEFTLSLHDIHLLEVRPDGMEAHVIKGRDTEFVGTLEEALRFIQNHHWVDEGD